MNVSGTRGRSLVQAAHSTIGFPLRLAGPVRFSAKTVLIDIDWRDARGAIRPWVAVDDHAGARHELWSGSLACAAEGGEPHALLVDCELPMSAESLVLGCDQLPPRDGTPVGRALWLEPTIVDPIAPRGAVDSETARSPQTPRATARDIDGRAADLGAHPRPRPAARDARGGDRSVRARRSRTGSCACSTTAPPTPR